MHVKFKYAPDIGFFALRATVEISEFSSVFGQAGADTEVPVLASQVEPHQAVFTPVSG